MESAGERRVLKGVKVLSIVIPAYNEETSIIETVNRCFSALEQLSIKYEIIVIDDYSTDNTNKRLNELQQQYSVLKIINNPINSGYGKSLKQGILSAKFEIICILDADGTYDPEYIPQFYNTFQKGLDLLIGKRSGKHFRGKWYKFIMRKIYYYIISFIAGTHIPDANSGLRMFKKSQIIQYFPHLCNTFSFTTSQTLLMSLGGYFVKFIDIDYHDRKGKTKVKLFKDSLRTLQYMTQAIIRYNPIKFFLLLSCPFFVFSLIFILLFILLGNFYLFCVFLVSIVLSILIILQGFISYAIISK